MRYLMLVYSDESDWTEEERQSCMDESSSICRELKEQGKLIDASPLQPVSTATSLRIRSGKKQITDGPFAETREQLGGYFLIDVSNLDEALSIADRLPPAKKGTIEIRPLLELPALVDIRS